MPLDWRLINSEVLVSIDLDGLLRNSERYDCSHYQTEISRCEQDETLWSPDQRECLHFIGATLTMVLRADHAAEPFGPMFVMDGQRSAIPSDFPKERLQTLEPWAMSLGDPELRARFLDVIWVQTKSFLAAQAAVDAYLASALRLEDPEEWTFCQKRLERALRLAASLGKGGVDLRDEVLAEIEAMLQRHCGNDPLYLTFRLIRLLLEFRYGDANQFAGFAKVAAESAEESRDFWRAKDYYQLLADCYRAVGNKDGETEALRCSAEGLVK